ncbi:MAG: histidine kinase [Ginsengibacter sp.]
MPGYFHLIGLVKESRKFFFGKAPYILFTILVLYCNTYAQRTKIESLKTALPFLNGSARVDSLNVLSLLYTYLQSDSAKLYAEKAYTESAAINYQRGMVMSMNSQARIAGLGFRNFPLQEKICLETIRQYKNLGDEKALTETYMNLALALFCQSYFDRSAAVCDTLIQISQKSNNYKELGEAIAIMGAISFESGNYEKAFEYFNHSLEVFKSIDDSYNTAIVLAKIGDLYLLAGDNKTALNFYFQSLAFPKESSIIWYPLVDVGDVYYLPEQYDSSLSKEEAYTRTIKSLTIRSNSIMLPGIRTAEALLASKDYDKALVVFNDGLKLSRKNNDKNYVMRLLLDIGRSYEGKKEYAKAFYFARELLEEAIAHKARQYIRDGNKLMFILYDHIHDVDSAYFYYRQYTSMKDSVALSDFSKKIAISKAATEDEQKQAKIELLNNEKLINQQKLQLSNTQLKSESFEKNILISGVLVLLLLGFIIFRNIRLKQKNEANRHEIIEKEFSLQKLESERISNEMQQQATELKLQALRAQMNPHFIFNCLNSINRFITANEPEMAADHLTKFAKLIRIVLQQSGKAFIPLEDELFCLQLYMDLEALRFEIPFAYEIHTNGIDTSNTLLPSLLLQPFVENAIWHGLQGNKNVKGNIIINMSLQNSILHCKIADNGIGRTKANSLAAKEEKDKTSLGIQLTEHRLQLTHSLNKEDAGVTISDERNEYGEIAGTSVDIKIPVKVI